MKIMKQIAENLTVIRTEDLTDKLSEFELKISSTMIDSKTDSKGMDFIDSTEWYFPQVEQDSPHCLTHIMIL